MWPARSLADRPVRDRWVTLSPDEDLVEEDLDQLGNPTMIVGLDDDGSRPFLAEEIYAFKTPVDDSDMVGWLRKGREIVLADAREWRVRGSRLHSMDELGRGEAASAGRSQVQAQHPRSEGCDNAGGGLPRSAQRVLEHHLAMRRLQGRRSVALGQCSVGCR